jgi:hypothetical protein
MIDGTFSDYWTLERSHMSELAEIVLKVDRLPATDEMLSVRWEGASTEDAIASVEKALGVQIRGSYRDLLLTTGGGGLDPLYISPIPAHDPLASGCYRDTLHYREDWCPHKLPPHLVVIQRDADDNEPVCLDTSKVVGGENPVVLFYYQSTGHSEKLADSFIQYYLDFLEPYFDEAGL